MNEKVFGLFVQDCHHQIEFEPKEVIEYEEQ